LPDVICIVDYAIGLYLAAFIYFYGVARLRNAVADDYIIAGTGLYGAGCYLLHAP
jgi:hypothetical protein